MIHPGFETQDRHHQKSKTGVYVSPEKWTNVLQIFIKKMFFTFILLYQISISVTSLLSQDSFCTVPKPCRKKYFKWFFESPFEASNKCSNKLIYTASMCGKYQRKHTRWRYDTLQWKHTRWRYDTLQWKHTRWRYDTFTAYTAVIQFKVLTTLAIVSSWI